MTAALPRTLAIDVGGTGLKMLVLDAAGEPISERSRLETPRPATPEAVLDALAEMAAEHGEFDRVSVGFPGVVREGIILTAPNLDGHWAGFALAQQLEQRLGAPCRVANDADVQGLGMIEGRGVELMVTLGTGFGSALFTGGRLVPNLELGHHPFKNDKTYEQLLGKAALDKHGKEVWRENLVEAVDLLSRIFNFDVLYLGGGHAAKVAKWQESGKLSLPDNVRTTDNVAGLLGGIALWRDA